MNQSPRQTTARRPLRNITVCCAPPPLFSVLASPVRGRPGATQAVEGTTSAAAGLWRSPGVARPLTSQTAAYYCGETRRDTHTHRTGHRETHSPTTWRTRRQRRPRADRASSGGYSRLCSDSEYSSSPWPSSVSMVDDRLQLVVI